MLTRNPRITAAGLALFTNQAPGFSVAVTHIALGAAIYDPTGTEVALKSEFARFPIESGADISPSQIQVGVLVTNTDPQSRSANNNHVGEIGFYVGDTLLAVLSQSGRALFYKSPDLDIPISYILDFSTLPPGSITVGAPGLSGNLQLAAQTAQAEAAAARNAHAGAVATLKAIQASYYGAFPAAPAARPDGSARQKGDRYFDTTEGAEKTWGGTVWYVANIDAAAVADALGRRGVVLGSRAALTAIAATLDLDNGTCVVAGGERYAKQAGAAAFADLPGFVPFGAASPEHWGIATGVDETAKVAQMLKWCAERGVAIEWGAGPYCWANIAISQPAVNLSFKNRAAKTVFRYTGTSGGIMLDLAATTLRTITMIGPMYANGTRIELGDTSGIVPGMMALVMTSRVIETDDRGQARHGWAVPISRVVDAAVIEVERPFPVSALVGTESGSVTAVGTAANTITVASFIGRKRVEMRYRVRLSSPGANPTSFTLLPSDFDPDTGTFVFDKDTNLLPVGVTAGDYLTVERDISVIITRPTAFQAEGNFLFEKDIVTKAIAGDAGATALRVQRGNRPVVRGVSTIGFSECGVNLLWCYGHQVKDGHHAYCNRAYNGVGGTGYGVSVSQSSWGKVSGVSGFSCRRTVDVGGTQGVSYENEIVEISGYGGGTDYTGGRFSPVGLTESSVAGSHGGAQGTRYVNARGANINIVIVARGMNELVRGVYGAGAINALAFIQYGDQPHIDGLYYTDGMPDWVSSDIYAYSASIGGTLGNAVVVNANNTRSGRPVKISNYYLSGVRTSLVLLNNATGTVKSLGGIVIGPGTIEMHGNGADDFYVVRSGTSGAIKITGPVVFARDINLIHRQYARKTVARHIYVTEFAWDNGTLVKLPSGEVMVRCADDGVVQIPTTRFGTALVSIRARNNARAYRGLNMMLEQATAGDKNPAPSSVNVDVIASVPTGTTGVDGKVTLSLCPAGGLNSLYIENRSGANNEWLVVGLSELAF